MRCQVCGKELEPRVVSHLPKPPYEGPAQVAIETGPLYWLNGFGPLCGAVCAVQAREAGHG